MSRAKAAEILTPSTAVSGRTLKPFIKAQLEEHDILSLGFAQTLFDLANRVSHTADERLEENVISQQQFYVNAKY